MTRVCLPLSSSICVLLAAAAVTAVEPAIAADPLWSRVTIPEAWTQPPAGKLAPIDGFAWYRCVVRLPDSWRERSVELFVEPVDDARQTYFNGQLVGTAGTLPPLYRSGLGETSRFRLPPVALRPGADNVVAVRVYSSDGRTNFAVAAPVILAGDEGIRLEGGWQYRPGDDPAWATLGDDAVEAGAALDVYSTVDDVDDVRTYISRRKGDHPPLPPAEAVKRFHVAEDLEVEIVLAEPDVEQPLSLSFDERGRLWVLEYRQYPNPAGMKVTSRDKYLRTVYDRISPPPPNHFIGRDRITIHEDTDGDGAFDAHRVFVEGLNIATSFARGRGGVWVLNPPYLLFYPDRDNDDVPDDNPDVHLEGFGLEDTHSVANSLCWGPDGWLYAAQGSTVTGKIRRPGDATAIHSMGQLIWRYHPERGDYEIFAEGGGNAFGVEIDAKGRIFSGHNGGNTRGFHYVQGGFSAKGFGKHGALSNPYAFGYFKAMGHHDAARFSHTFVIYEGGALPDRYHGKLIGLEPLQGQIVQSDLRTSGSTFETKDISRPLTTEDQWFRPVDIKVAPDGALYVADFHEQRIDHSSHFAGRVAGSSGRIYRLREKNAGPRARFNLSALSSAELTALFGHSNRWFRRSALRLFGDRRDSSVVPRLLNLLETGSGQVALEALWALNLSGGLTDNVASSLLGHADPYVRLWTARLACDDRRVSERIARTLKEMASNEPHVEVRSQLACSARRLDVHDSLAVVRALLSRDEDADDLHIPLLLWWALEANVTRNRDAVLKLFETASLWDFAIVERHILSRLMRRFASEGTRQSFTACAQLLNHPTNKRHVELLLDGFEQGVKGRSLTRLPDELIDALARSGGGSLALRLRRRDPDATSQALSLIRDNGSEELERLELLDILREVPQPSSLPAIVRLVRSSSSDAVRLAALAAVESHDAPEIASDLLESLPPLPGKIRDAVFRTLASRMEWARALLDACDRDRVKGDAVPVEALRKLLLHGDNDIAARVRERWGTIEGSTTAAMKSRIAALVKVLEIGSGNPYRGKRHFRERCHKCHVFLGEGGDIGPDLTSAERSDLPRLLENLVNPSAEIREGYENYAAITRDGRVLTGFLVDQDQHVIVLRDSDGKNAIVPRAQVVALNASGRSLMPEGLLASLADQDVRDLFAYLRSTQPLPD